MLLAWNYQNSAAVRNGTSGPDLATMTNLWEQYQSALGLPTSKPSEQGSPVSVNCVCLKIKKVQLINFNCFEIN